MIAHKIINRMKITGCYSIVKLETSCEKESCIMVELGNFSEEANFEFAQEKANLLGIFRKNREGLWGVSLKNQLQGRMG